MKDVKTTQIYTHVLNRNGFAVEDPADRFQQLLPLGSESLRIRPSDSACCARRWRTQWRTPTHVGYLRLEAEVRRTNAYWTHSAGSVRHRTRLPARNVRFTPFPGAASPASINPLRSRRRTSSATNRQLSRLLQSACGQHHRPLPGQSHHPRPHIHQPLLPIGNPSIIVFLDLAKTGRSTVSRKESCLAICPIRTIPLPAPAAVDLTEARRHSELPFHNWFWHWPSRVLVRPARRFVLSPMHAPRGSARPTGGWRVDSECYS